MPLPSTSTTTIKLILYFLKNLSCLYPLPLLLSNLYFISSKSWLPLPSTLYYQIHNSFPQKILVPLRSTSTTTTKFIFSHYHYHYHYQHPLFYPLPSTMLKFTWPFQATTILIPSTLYSLLYQNLIHYFKTHLSFQKSNFRIMSNSKNALFQFQNNLKNVQKPNN